MARGRGPLTQICACGAQLLPCEELNCRWILHFVTGAASTDAAPRLAICFGVAPVIGLWRLQQRREWTFNACHFRGSERSEERRVGKECRSRRWTHQAKEQRNAQYVQTARRAEKTGTQHK